MVAGTAAAGVWLQSGGQLFSSTDSLRSSASRAPLQQNLPQGNGFNRLRLRPSAARAFCIRSCAATLRYRHVEDAGEEVAVPREVYCEKYSSTDKGFPLQGSHAMATRLARLRNELARLSLRIVSSAFHNARPRNESRGLPQIEQRMKGLAVVEVAGGAFRIAGGLRVKSCFKDHFLLVMAPSKGQVDHDVRQPCAWRLCRATAVPFQTFDYIFRAPQSEEASSRAGVTSTTTRK